MGKGGQGINKKEKEKEKTAPTKKNQQSTKSNRKKETIECLWGTFQTPGSPVSVGVASALFYGRRLGECPGSGRAARGSLRAGGGTCAGVLRADTPDPGADKGL
eukprot:Hpha_TRINITY_DN22128_c0_g1::TRINITY_DN22128_c0_g1_i1::g.103573::m.103573